MRIKSFLIVAPPLAFLAEAAAKDPDRGKYIGAAPVGLIIAILWSKAKKK